MNLRLSISLCLAACCGGALHALDFEGLPDKVITVVPEKSTGLEAVYVLRQASGVTATYPSATAT